MKNFGPGFLVTAAFIGPGTVTTATLAGANFGYSLLWALLFSVFATLVLQEMACRLGVVSGKGLSENLREQINSKILRWIALAMVLLAIGLGNAAYEAGNLTGAAIGMRNVFGGEVYLWAAALGVAAMLIMLLANFKVLTLLLTSLVFVMSIVFIVTMLVAQPSIAAMAKGALIPSLPDKALLTTIGLIGTTVVPYNLFLHANLAANFKPELEQSQRLGLLRKDLLFAIAIGGLVTIAIISTSAASFFAQQSTPDINNIAVQLEPTLGEFAPMFFAIGLFAAGITSAVTAPLAAAFAICGVLGQPAQHDNRIFKLVWFTILVIGVALCFLQIKPLTAILLAQVSNGLLLPVIAGFLLWICNQSTVMKSSANTLLHNIVAGLIILLVLFLSLFKLQQLF